MCTSQSSRWKSVCHGHDALSRASLPRLPGSNLALTQLAVVVVQRSGNEPVGAQQPASQRS
eukprot:4403060-Heterocapsa_arctica.AAC.1